MRIEQLEQVVRITECGSINKAATDLYMTQSNLSQSIKSLENEIGNRIFTRTGKGIELTKFGSEFIHHALATYNQFHLTNEFCKNFSDRPPLIFSVACQYMRFANLLFMRLHEKYAESYTEFSFLECSFLDILNHVVSNRAELGILVISQRQKKTTQNLIRARGLIYSPILACPASVTIGPKNPLYHATDSQVNLDMLIDFPIVMYRDMTFNFAEELTSSDIYRNKNKIIVSDRNTLHEILENSTAFSIAAYTGAYSKTEYYSKIRALELADSRVSFELGWVRNNSAPPSALALEYIDMIERSL